MPRLKKVNTTDKDLQKIQDNIQAALDAIDRSQILEGVTLDSTASNVVPHKLGRRLIGWTVIDKSAQSDIWKETSSAPELNLVLRCSADVVVSLRVE